MAADDRDMKFERALAQHLRSDSGAVGCPNAETLAAYHERSLSLEEMAHWKQHIAGCALCQEALALVEATEKELAEDWQGEDVPVLEAAGVPQSRARVIAPGKEDVPVEEIADTAAAPVEITQRRRPRLMRWAVPVGAVAAGVLVWIGIHEQRALQSARSSAVQVAQNQPVAAPERKMNEVLPKAVVPAESDTRQARLDSQMENKKADTLEREAGRTAQMAPAAKPVAPGNDLVAPKKETRDQFAGAVAEPPVLPKAGSAAPQARPPASGTETVEVTNAAPTLAQTPPTPSPSGNFAAGVVGGRGRESDAKSGVSSGKNKAELRSQTAENLNTNAMMMKQGVNNRAMQAASINSGLILTPDNSVWWRLGSVGTVELTSDGGVHWKTLNTGAGSQLTTGSAPSSGVCWIAGKSGTLLLTTDRGAHWSKVASPITGDLGGVHASDKKHASIWDAANRVAFETADGGATWKAVANE